MKQVSITTVSYEKLGEIGSYLNIKKRNEVADLCIHSAYDNLEHLQIYQEKTDNISEKLDLIIALLYQILPEV